MKFLALSALLALYVSVAMGMSLRGRLQQKTDDVDFSNVVPALPGGMGALTDVLPDLRRTQKEREKSQRTGVDNVIDVCYFCDANCQYTVNQGNLDHNVMNTYFQGITNQLSENLARLDPGLSANYYYSVYYDSPIQLQWFGSDMESVNSGFWQTDDLFEAAHSFGCDTAFLVAAPSDALLSASSTTGVANMYGICGDNSYGIVAEGSFVAPLLSHEVGHLLGMYHSNEAVNAANFANVKDKYPAEYDAIFAKCPDTGCGSDCIMNSIVSAGATDYGECGKAYYNLMKAMSADYPKWYPLGSCYDLSDKKRQIEEAPVPIGPMD